MRRIRLNDTVINRSGEKGLVIDVLFEEENESRCFVDFPNQGGWYDESELRLADTMTAEEEEAFVEQGTSFYERTPLLDKLYIPVPTYKDFLILWNQFNDLANQLGITNRFFNRDDAGYYDWNYFFYSNGYPIRDRNLLEYCITNGIKDIVCISNEHITRFGMSAFQLEPETDEHNEKEGIIRRATEVEVLHFSGVRTVEDLEEELLEMMATGGFLKIIVAFPEDEVEPWEFKHAFRRTIASWYQVNNQGAGPVEYILLLPTIHRDRITWEHWVLNHKGQEIIASDQN